MRRHSLHHRRARVFIALTGGLAFSAAPAISSEIFKCVAKDGTALYQNFPCDIDSIGSQPTSPPATKPKSPPPSDATTTKSNPAAVSVASTVKSASASEPRIGMTSDEVRTLWGEPEDVVEEEPGDGPRVSIWRYAGGMTIQFDHKHHVLGVQR